MGGEAIASEDLLFPLNRKGRLEDCYFTYSYCPIRDEEGGVGGFLATVIETTSRVNAELESKKVQSELLMSETLLRLVADRLPAFVSYMDTERRYQFVNRRYSDWFEKPRSEIEGKTRKELIADPSTYAQMVRYEDRAFAGEQVLYELTLTKPNGESVNLDTEYLPDIDPVTGKVRGIVNVGQDVTERKKALLEVADSERRYRSLTDSIPQMMWTSTADGKVNYANDRCLQYSGVSTQAKYGDAWFTMIHPADSANVGEAWLRSMKAGQPFKEEYRIKRADGEYRWFLGRAIAIKSSSGIIQYWIGTATDIDDQKKTSKELELAKEIAENANATKSAFLANMSHEIRTPLGAILGFSSLLKDVNLPIGDRDQYIDTINRNGQSLTRIIDDILDLAKVEAGRLDVEEIDFSLFDLVAEVVDLFKEKAKQKGIYLFTSIDENVPHCISSDPTRIRQILINILGNAIKFTDTGGVRMRVRAAPDLRESLKISVDVKDTGCGLTEEQKARLFKPFTQADNTTTRQFGGTGLGLALSKRLSEALGGDIAIEKYVPNEGCTFVVTFLAAPAKSLGRARQGVKTAVPSSANALHQLRVLLVDDSPDNQLLVKRFLTKNGAHVEVANDGLQAVEMALSKTYEIVLMDIQMPHMDGYQAIKALREKNYQTPIIALTAHAMLEDRAKTQAAGFVSHLTKPIDMNDLLSSVRQNAKPIP